MAETKSMQLRNPKVRYFRGLAAAVLLATAGCQSPGVQSAANGARIDVEEAPRWHRTASPEDVQRIDRLDAAWEEALSEARRAGLSRQIAAEGRLLEPSAAVPRPAPAPGSYMCRVIKIGGDGPRTRAFQAFRPFFCHVGVEGDRLSITKQTGSERPGGYLFEDADANRLIFLGSMALGNEDVPRPYREDPARDMVGVFERIAPMRYRLVAPFPRGGSKLDIIEFVPAPVQRNE